MFKNKKKNSRITTSISELRKNTNSILGYTPADYVNSPEFSKISVDRDEWAKQQIKGIALNEFSSSLLDAKIDAQAIREIANAKAQKVKHNAVIKDLSNLLDSEAVKAKEELVYINNDIVRDKLKLDVLLKIQNQLNIKNWGDEK